MKAIIYIYKPLADTKEKLAALEQVAKNRAASLGATVVRTIWGLSIWADPMAILKTECERVDAALIVTPSLEHIGGDSAAVVPIASLATIQPADGYWPWEVPDELWAEISAKHAALDPGKRGGVST